VNTVRAPHWRRVTTARKRACWHFEQPLAVAGPDDIFIVFDKEPLMRGLDFDRKFMEPAQTEINGVTRWIWRSTHGSQRGADGWWNSALFNVTDERFKNGGRPAVDMSVTFRNPANAPVELAADTATGSRIVATGWGNDPNWQTMRHQLDNARFARTKTGADPKDRLTDGVDLRFNECNDQVQLRSIFIRGYDLDKNPDYKRLLRYDGIDAGRPIYLFTPGEKQDLSIKLRNIARVAMPAVYTVRLLDDMGNAVWRREEKKTVPAAQSFNLPVAFDTKGLKQGVYTIGLSLGRTGSDGKFEELLAPRANVLVSEKSAIPKARDNEFWYGLDIINGTHQEEHYMWADFMGADILRGVDSPMQAEPLRRALDRIKKYNLRTQLFFEPRWDADEATRNRRTAEEAARAEAIAREFGEQILTMIR
jgi:hypothetical protein